MSEAGPGTVSMLSRHRNSPNHPPAPPGEKGKVPLPLQRSYPLCRPSASGPERHRNSPARHTVQDTPSPCTPRGEGEGSPSAAAQLSPLSAFGLRSRNGIETVPHGMPCRTHHPPAPHRQDRHPSVPHAGPASSCQYSCGADPRARRRRSSSQAEQVLQLGGAGPFSRGTPAPPIQHPRFPAAQVLQEKTDLRQNAPGLAPGCPRTCPGQLGARAILLPSLP
jgi:hypothetical protein